MLVHETSPLQEPTIRDTPVLRERHVLLLSEIERLKRAPGDLRPEPGKIYGLEREYNRLVDEEAQMAINRHVDPLEVLPPELWGDIIPDGIDEALKLTLVSGRWCQTVLSMPQLWTTVTLLGQGHKLPPSLWESENTAHNQITIARLDTGGTLLFGKLWPDQCFEGTDVRASYTTPAIQSVRITPMFVFYSLFAGLSPRNDMAGRRESTRQSRALGG